MEPTFLVLVPRRVMVVWCFDQNLLDAKDSVIFEAINALFFQAVWRMIWCIMLGTLYFVRYALFKLLLLPRVL